MSEVKFNEDLISLVKQNFMPSRNNQTEVYVEYTGMRNEYFVGKYNKLDSRIRLMRIVYPASSPSGYIRCSGIPPAFRYIKIK